MKKEIAPDHVQYAVRLARWTGLAREEILPTPATRSMTERFSVHWRMPAPRLAAYVLAQSRLAVYLQSLSHESTRNNTFCGRYYAMGEVGQYLMHSARLNAHEFDFDLHIAFEDRLADLRARFDLPEPSSPAQG